MDNYPLQALGLLREPAVAVAVAFARRINHTETYESVINQLIIN